MPSDQRLVLRAFDFGMLELHNGKERDLGDWEGVIREADERLSLETVNKEYGSHLSILQIGWIENI